IGQVRLQVFLDLGERTGYGLNRIRPELWCTPVRLFAGNGELAPDRALVANPDTTGGERFGDDNGVRVRRGDVTGFHQVTGPGIVHTGGLFVRNCAVCDPTAPRNL